jgi:hypothetical protein
VVNKEDDSSPAITTHGRRRARQRSAGVSAVKQAYKRGVPKEAVTGQLRKYLEEVIGGGRTVRLYAGQIFLFSQDDSAFITVLPLPGRLQRLAAVATHRYNKTKAASERL